MAVRLNRFLMFIGRRGTGKTTIAKEFATKSGMKICIIDTDDHPSYNDVVLLQLENLKDWRSGNIRVITSEPLKALDILRQHCVNAFIILEDCRKYIDSNVQKEVRAFIIDHRKRNFDIALMFHYLGDVPPYICKQYDYMLLFKTGDNLQDRQKKFSNWHTIVTKLKRILKHKSFNYCETIAVDE